MDWASTRATSGSSSGLPTRPIRTSTGCPSGTGSRSDAGSGPAAPVRFFRARPPVWHAG